VFGVTRFPGLIAQPRVEQFFCTAPAICCAIGMPSPSSGLGVLVLNWAAVPPTPRTNNTTCASRWWRRAIVAQRPRLHTEPSFRKVTRVPSGNTSSAESKLHYAPVRGKSPGPPRPASTTRERPRAEACAHGGPRSVTNSRADRIFSEVQRQNQNLNKVKSLPAWPSWPPGFSGACVRLVGACVEALFSLLTLQ